MYALRRYYLDRFLHLFELEEAARLRIYLAINIVGTNIVMKIFEWFEYDRRIVMIKKELELLKASTPTGKKKWPLKAIENILFNEKPIGVSLG